MIVLAATETVTSPTLWTQVAAVAGAIGACLAALGVALKYVPGIRSLWARRQNRMRLERVEAARVIAEEIMPPIIQRETEPRFAEMHGEVAATRAELVAHTLQERLMVRAVMETAVRVKAMRQSDVDEIRRAMDADEESFEQVRGEIPPET